MNNKPKRGERTRRKLSVMREEDTLIFIEREDGYEQRIALTINELREKLDTFGLKLIAAEAKA